MLAVDTNVIVRYLTGDDAEQFAKASALIRSEDVYVCTTVLLETEWVLRRGYRFGELCWNLGDAVIRRRSVLACW